MITTINEFRNSLNENLVYYQDLVNADRQRLKNATGGEAEMIQQNLNFNLKKLNALKRSSKNKIITPETTKVIEPETYKKNDKVLVYIDGYWQPGKVVSCYDDTDFKNRIEIDIAIQGEDHSIKVKTHDKTETYGVDGLNTGQWNRQLKKA